MELIAQELSKKRLKGDIMNYFNERVRSGLHICLNFSPVGKLRQRIRQFPSIINCCTINWLQPWPHEALLLIGSQLLMGLDMANPVDRITGLLVEAHRLVGGLAV
jgi:dynein heavy chain